VVPRYQYGELPRLRALRGRSNRYSLRTDISQFYPAMYTHTIPWALHKKDVCKAALLTANKGKHLLGNKIDKALQGMNEGQTHGIPIGPDASLVVAEVLLTAVDETILSQYSDILRGFRYVDDYELSFAKLSEAEQMLTELQGVLAQYELTLNPRKTQLEESPRNIVDRWAVELGRFPLRDSASPAGQRNDILAMVSRAFEVASEHAETPVLRYVISRVQNENVSSRGWRAFQNSVLSAASAEPSAMGVALGTLHQVASLGGHSVAKSPLAEVFENVISRHAPLGQGSEVAWALWGALAWSIPLSDVAAQAVSTMDDDIVALLALGAEVKGLLPIGALNKQSWTATVSQPDVLQSEHWLLAYEANRQNWIPCPVIVSDPVFSTMHSAAVSFYDPSQNTPQFPPGARTMPGGSLPDFYA
jgi:Reverse transcriptase (RNA-dependent DNA polymerase)